MLAAGRVLAPGGRTPRGGPDVTRYRFLDGMGEVVADEDFDDHAAALRWALADDGPEEDVQRVEFLGPDGDWGWAGALQG